MSKSPKQTGTQTSTTRMEMPDWLEQSYFRGTGMANDAYSRDLQPFISSQAPGFSNLTKMGMNQQRVQAGQGVNPLVNQQYDDTLAGNYLYGGEGFDAAQQAAENRIIPRVTSAFNQANRMGGEAGPSELSRQIGDSFAGLYNNERNRQMGALSMAPSMDTLQYEPARHLLQMGAMQDAQNLGRTAVSDQNRYAQQRNQQNATDAYLQRLGVFGGTGLGGQTTRQPVYSQDNTFGNILGTGLAVAGLATGNPWIGLAGGAGGGLLGSGGSVGGSGLYSVPGLGVVNPTPF